MKKFLLIIFLLIALALLSACATPMTATPTALIVTTPTSTPTSIPPTATIEPSPTVDPNMPEGATGKDVNGNYTKTENGLTVTWNADLKTWERHIMVNDTGIPLFPHGTASHSMGLTDQMMLHVNISDKVPGFDKIESLSFVGITGDGLSSADYPEFANLFNADVQIALKERMGSKFIGFQQLGSGELSLSFTTTERSEPWSWKLGPNTTVDVDIVAAPVGSGFQTWKCPMWKDLNKSYIFQTRLFTDDQGNLHVWFVPDPTIPIDQYAREDDMTMYLFGVASIMNNSDQTQQYFSMKLASYSALGALPGRTIFDFVPPQ
jgi:hypothetical protein